MSRIVRLLIGIFVLSVAASAAWSQGAPDFSGLWKQDNDRCQPRRTSDVTMRIEQRDPELTVETSILRTATISRHAVQKYTTDGKVSQSTGADGDEFNTSVVWKDSSLVFTIEEHEDGRILHSKETWSVIEDGATLMKVRERVNDERQTVFFHRIQASHSDGDVGLIKARDR